MGKKATLIEEWDSINILIDSNQREFIDKYYSDKERPTIIYSLSGYTGILEEHITEIILYKQGRPILFGKRPTRKLVNELYEWATNYIPTIDDIQLRFERQEPFHKVSGARSLKEIDDKSISYYRDKLLPRLKELQEKYAPRPGHISCSYCRKQVLAEEMVDCTIISRQYPGMKKVNKYCSKECGTHDQWAHEG